LGHPRHFSRFWWPTFFVVFSCRFTPGFSDANHSNGDGDGAPGHGIGAELLPEEIATDVMLLAGDNVGDVFVSNQVGSFGEQDSTQFPLPYSETLPLGADVGEFISGWRLL
jgi:hypothetical protein